MNCLLQLQAIYNKKSTYYKMFKEVDFFFPLRIIGRGLYLLLSIDAMVTESTFYEKSFLTTYWQKYMDNFNMVLADPTRFGLDPEKMKLLKRIIVKVDKCVMSGDCLNAFLNSLAERKNMNAFEEMRDFEGIRANKYIMELLKNYFKHAQSTIEARFSDEKCLHLQDNAILAEYLCVFSFYMKFFKQESKDVWRNLWSLQKKELMIYIHRFIMIRVCDILMRYCRPKKIYSSLEPKDINALTVDVLKRNQDNLMVEVTGLYRHLCQWLLKMNSMACSMYVFQTAKEVDRVKIFELRMSQIISGLNLACRIRAVIRKNFLIRQKIGFSLSPEQIKPFMLLIEMSRKIVEIVEQKDVQLMQDMMVKFSCLRVAKVVKEYCSKVTAQKMNDKTFFIEAFKTVFYLLTHFPSEQRESLSQFCLTFFTVKNIIKDPEVIQFKRILEETFALSRYKQLFREILDCSYLYWYKEFIPDMLDLKTTADGELYRLQHLVDAFSETKYILRQAVHLEDNQKLTDTFRDYILKSLETKIIKKASVSLEEDLLIQTHHFYTISELQKPNPMQKFQGDLKSFLSIRKICVIDKLIDMKHLIEMSLSENLYNRISDNQKNFTVYEIMRTLAKVKYDLDLGHSYIPSKTVEQGRTDVLAILRSLVFFIQNFKYNMFNQTFIETLNESTRLKAVSINLISDSIKTHGLGIVRSSISMLVETIHKYDIW